MFAYVFLFDFKLLFSSHLCYCTLVFMCKCNGPQNASTEWGYIPRPNTNTVSLFHLQYLHRYHVVHVQWCMRSCLNQMRVPPVPSSWLTPAQIMGSDSQMVPANLSLGRGLQSLLDCLVYVLLCVCVCVIVLHICIVVS